MLTKQDIIAHESHQEIIKRIIGYDRWVSRTDIGNATKSLAITARISGVRKLLRKSGSTLICYVKKNQHRTTQTYYAIVAKGLLEKEWKTTYYKSDIPPRVVELIGHPEKLGA